ncbi:uncharacterized protein LOC114363604 isoform X1 [Ostrinia furnacalis]|uniref:uncharacterized protein LOC114363604 isoform X1 n=1 Tax=Ostrinia furnacalis TaxID=93504 RepID=UPI00103D4F50|nr:uncharacterized protein LOC114363604 isoform X1 [Ostrinia furnacalis]
MPLKIRFFLALTLVYYVECFYIAGDGKLPPINIQVYEEVEGFGPARVTRNIDYIRSAGVQRDQTVIVVPNQGTRQSYGYGTYGSSSNRGQTVVVVKPDQYNRGVLTDPYIQV